MQADFSVGLGSNDLPWSSLEFRDECSYYDLKYPEWYTD